MDWKVRGSK